jgi:hypothetical protein
MELRKMNQLYIEPLLLIEYKPSSLFKEPVLSFSIYQKIAKKQDYVLSLDKRFAIPDGFVECVSSFRELYTKVNGFLKSSPNTLFVIEKLDFSKKDKKRKEKIRLLLIKHNSRRNLEKRI